MPSNLAPEKSIFSLNAAFLKSASCLKNDLLKAENFPKEEKQNRVDPSKKVRENIALSLNLAPVKLAVSLKDAP